MSQILQLPLARPVPGRDHVQGSPVARVAVVEYGDFECPSCAQARPALRIMVQHFQPDVCLVYRHFPLVETHPHAIMAAEASEAAAAQGKFWAMHDALFQRELHLNRNEINRCALAANLDMMRFEREMASGEHRARVEEDIQSGRANHVMSTPAIFLNGELCDVSFGMEHLHHAIEQVLAGGGPTHEPVGGGYAKTR